MSDICARTGEFDALAPYRSGKAIAAALRKRLGSPE
jgi:hypothetical protein